MSLPRAVVLLGQMLYKAYSAASILRVRSGPGGCWWKKKKQKKQNRKYKEMEGIKSISYAIAEINITKNPFRVTQWRAVLY